MSAHAVLTVRERLPQGDPRNKIEFLADEMQRWINLQTVPNFVHNPAFLDESSNRAQQSNFTGSYVPGASLGSPWQNSGAFADGWNFEHEGVQLTQGRAAAFSCARNLYFKPFHSSVPFPACDIIVAATNSKGTIYQNLHLPKRDAYYKARAIFAAKPGMTVSVGFRKTDSSMVYSLRDEKTIVTTADMYQQAPLSGYELVVLESEPHHQSPGNNHPPLVCLDVQSRPDQMDQLILIGMQVIEVTKEGEPLQIGLIDMACGKDGYTRFKESVPFSCEQTNVAGNVFEFESRKPGLSLHCPEGVHAHVSSSTLYFYGTQTNTSGDLNGAKILDLQGGRLTVELPQDSADLVRNCQSMDIYLRYTATPFHRGIYVS